MAVTTADEFRKLLEASGILSNAQLERAQHVVGEETDLRQLARTLIRENLITTWQARQLLAGVSSLKLGKYKLLDELGRSELGRVYLAEHSQLGRRAALKLLSRDLSSQPSTLQQFLVDARSIASIDHTHVVHTLDVASEGDRYYVVFEYVDGRNLAKVIEDEGAIAPARAVEWIRQAADGLSFAHERAVFHADLKPGNLIVDTRGQVKILDLGVARLSSSAHAQPDSAGKPVLWAEEAFRAPELLANPDAVTAASDLYSLGMALFCLLAGQMPCPPDSELAPPTADSLLTQLSVLCPNLPDDLVAICGRLLALAPQDRFRSAAEVREVLAGWLNHQAEKEAERDHRVDAVDPLPESIARESNARESATKDVAARESAGKEPNGARPAAKSARPQNAAATPRAPQAPSVDGKKTQADPASEEKRPAKPLPSMSSSSIDIARDAQFATESIVAAAEAEEVRTENEASKETLAFLQSPKRPGARSNRTTTAPKNKRPAGSPPKQATDETAPTPKSSRRNVPWIWIATAAGGVGIVAVIVFVVLVAMGGDHSQQIATTSTNSPAVAVTTSSTNSTSANPANTNPANTSPENAIPAEKVAATGPAVPKPHVNAAEGDKTPAGAPENGAAPVTPRPDVANALVENAPGPAKSPTDPQAPTAPVPSPEVPPAVPATPKPETVADAPAKPDVTPPPATPPPAPPTAPADPFVEFAAKFVELPLPGPEGAPAAPVSLGKIHLPEKGLLTTYLRGGDVAARGKSQFVLTAAEGGLAERDWEVFVREGDLTTGGTRIAQLHFKEDQLWFEWEPTAASMPVAPHLMNCVLELNGGSKQLQVAMRKPIAGEPLKADMFKSPQRGRWEVPYPPNYDQVKVEVAFVGPFGPLKYDGAMPFAVEKGKTFAWFGEQPEDQVWCYRVDTVLRKQLDVTFEAQMRAPPMGKLKRMQLSDVQLMYKNVVTEHQRQLQRTENVRASAAKMGEEAAQAINQKHEMLIASLLRLSQRLQAVGQLGEQLPNEGRLHVRAYYEVEGKQIELFRTNDFPAAPEKK